MRSRGWSENTSDSSSTPKVRLRLDHSLASTGDSSSLLQLYLNDKDSMKKAFKDYLVVDVKDLMLNLNMSTVVGLTDFIEDEIIPVPLPLTVSIYLFSIDKII